MDFGGPNVAKALHVGHLRSAVIGESIRRIESFYGNEVISDVHFGDWGTPMGMILAEIINQDGDLSKTESYDIEAISAFYKKPTSAARKTKPPRKKRGRLPPSCRTATRNTARLGSICARFRSTRSKRTMTTLRHILTSGSAKVTRTKPVPRLSKSPKKKDWPNWTTAH